MTRVRIEESYDDVIAYVDDVRVARWDHNDESHDAFFADLFLALKIDTYIYVEEC